MQPLNLSNVAAPVDVQATVYMHSNNLGLYFQSYRTILQFALATYMTVEFNEVCGEGYISVYSGTFTEGYTKHMRYEVGSNTAIVNGQTVDVNDTFQYLDFESELNRLFNMLPDRRDTVT